jgi:hypothetical protein
VRKVAFRLLALVAATGAAAIVAAACGSQDESTFAGSLDSGSPFEGGVTAPDGGVFGDAAGLVEANAVVLVHAASFPAFRVCFENTPNDLPQPSVDVMPESNVVGVDIGTAVRLPPRIGSLGRAFVFPEVDIRQYYPPFGGPGPSCEQVLKAAGMLEPAIDVGTVTADLSRGVHALVLGGCLGLAKDPAATTERCGADWDPLTGNLKLTTLSLIAFARAGDTRLPVQIVQLSPALAQRAAGRALGIAFGSLDGGDAGAGPLPFIEGAVPFGEAVPSPPAILDYAAADIGAYATSGVFVTLGAEIDDAGAPIDAGAADAAREVLISQSLADIQKRSSPRALPADWFSVASSYVVLSVGDINPKLGDGGADEDPRRALHLLAIPLAAASEAKDATPPPL